MLKQCSYDDDVMETKYWNQSNNKPQISKNPHQIKGKQVTVTSVTLHHVRGHFSHMRSHSNGAATGDQEWALCMICKKPMVHRHRVVGHQNHHLSGAERTLAAWENLAKLGAQFKTTATWHQWLPTNARCIFQTQWPLNRPSGRHDGACMQNPE